MNTAHWHLLLNHIPVTGVVLGTLVLIAGQLLKNDTVRRTALGIFVFASLMAVPAYLTGEGAEEMAEKLPGVTETAIEAHEESGKTFLILAILTGALALLAFFYGKRVNTAKQVFYGLVLVTGLATSVIAKQV